MLPFAPTFLNREWEQVILAQDLHPAPDGQLHGRRPKVVGARTREAENNALVRQVKAWPGEGIEPHAIGVADGTVPAPSAVTDVAADPVAHAQGLQRERCLLFVALTRARDHLYISYSGAPSSFLG